MWKFHLYSGKKINKKKSVASNLLFFTFNMKNCNNNILKVEVGSNSVNWLIYENNKTMLAIIL